MVIFGPVAGFLLAAVLISLAVFGLLPVFERRSQDEDLEHALVVECLENAEDLVDADDGADAVPRSLERYGAMAGGRWR
jgi:hypothetical protein